MQINELNLFNKDTNLFDANANNKLFKIATKYILINVIFATNYCICVDINVTIYYKINIIIVYVLNLLKVFNKVFEILSQNKDENRLCCFY